jgi:hypothetical protein
VEPGAASGDFCSRCASHTAASWLVPMIGCNQFQIPASAQLTTVCEHHLEARFLHGFVRAGRRTIKPALNLLDADCVLSDRHEPRVSAPDQFARFTRVLDGLLKAAALLITFPRRRSDVGRGRRRRRYFVGTRRFRSSNQLRTIWIRGVDMADWVCPAGMTPMMRLPSGIMS